MHIIFYVKEITQQRLTYSRIYKIIINNYLYFHHIIYIPDVEF